jgi:hypothetical protein
LLGDTRISAIPCSSFSPPMSKTRLFPDNHRVFVLVLSGIWVVLSTFKALVILIFSTALMSPMPLPRTSMILTRSTREGRQPR